MNIREEVVTVFKRASGDWSNIDFQQYSSYSLRVATGYLLIGFETDKALKYAVEHGQDGLDSIRKLSADFSISIN